MARRNKTTRWRVNAALLLASVGVLVGAQGVTTAGPTDKQGNPIPPAVDSAIVSAGPLTNISVTPDLSCQVNHTGDASPEFYPPFAGPGACGTLLATGGTLYGPAVIPAGGSAGPRTTWTMVSQTVVLGTGSASDPYRIVTVVAAGTTGLQLTETDSYVTGQESYRTDVKIDNVGTTVRTGTLYRAGDCYLQNSDYGYGRFDSATGAISCTATQAANSRIEQWFPLSSGSNYYETFYNTGWARIGTQTAFPNTCDCATLEDNWAGLSWPINLAPAGTLTLSHLTTFSPLGFSPLSTTKTADSATVPASGADGYTIKISNPNATAVGLASIFDNLPAGFTYTAGSTTGVTTANPSISGQALTWSGPFSVPATGSVSLHFNVTVSSTPGTYQNNAGGDAGTVAVAPTGPTAPVTVTPPVATGPQEATAFPESMSSDGDGNPIGPGASFTFYDDGVGTLSVSASAIGMDPSKTYTSYIFDNGSTATGPSPCTPGAAPLTPAQSLIGTWSVGWDGGGTLVVNKTGPSYTPLGTFATVAVVTGGVVVSCGAVGPAHT